MRMFISIILGLLFALATAMVGLGLAGGGHGWSGPLFSSLVLLILYPIAFIRTFASKTKYSDADAVLLGIAGVLDMLLLMSFLGESKYVAMIWRSDGGPLFLSLWLLLWAGWQGLILVSLVRRRAGRPGGDGG